MTLRVPTYSAGKLFRRRQGMSIVPTVMLATSPRANSSIRRGFAASRGVTQITHHHGDIAASCLSERALFALLFFLAPNTQRGLRARFEALFADRLLAQLADAEGALVDLA